MPSALMIVDVQQGMFAVQPPIHRGDEIVARIARLLERARRQGVPVVHIQHNGADGDVLAKGAAGWPHHPMVAPVTGELVVEKRNSSAFHATDLDRQLRDRNIDRLVIAGMQTLSLIHI